ncbi:MAG: hypothetical protein HN742_20815 [Lentisphaerae bacterium]|jgi:neutral ceramidase|nr:hypothetical protein [Lentisphaerota bacterium]MBT4818342.1 hypothetical protein [Lentisphaerota bacterium]MBT5610705.1 hypothetical protein [Lentisphaerota bacterium]MBT7054274.1 hypothetical protein [Lentisphaerota bacterium]MBT7844335.1 hypothetical protein [Lentisphaerota bacterium]
MLKAGAASIVINGELGAPIQGATVSQVANSVRDDLEANALLLGDGTSHALIISCDLAAVPSAFVEDTRAAVADAAGVMPRDVVMAGTHTHSGPSLISTSRGKPIDTAYLERLSQWLCDVAREARSSVRPVRLGWGSGTTRIGYNRRCCWSDGSHTMHGDTARREFTGLEGPDDHAHLALFLEDQDGQLVAILHNSTSHPTCFYGADFYSADFPGVSRRFLREALGPVPVVFLNGAFGDIANVNLLGHGGKGENREQKLLRKSHVVAGETLRLLHEATWCDDAAFAHVFEDIAMPVRLPTTARLEKAQTLLAEADAGVKHPIWDQLFAYGALLLQEEFGANPVDTIPVHALRIGDVALVTQPCELFCQFGLDIKRRSPARATGVCGIADGYSGYCPTIPGILGGGYSGEPIHWTRLAEDAGYRIVETASRLLHELW